MPSPLEAHRRTLRRVGQADGRSLAAFRAAVGCWLDDVLAIAADRRADIVLAIDEALTNCAEHAYSGRDTGTMTLDVSHDDESLRVRVTDSGNWSEPADADAHSPRGRGIRLMRGLSDELTIDGRPSGTTVRLLFGGCPRRVPG